MESKLVLASKSDKSIFERLIQLYAYDFSEFTLAEIDEHGLYGYYWLDYYWKDENRIAYLIRTAGEISGFVFIRIDESSGEKTYSIAEFFILRKYRKNGIGKTTAGQLFDIYRGHWNICVMTANRQAIEFWEKTVGFYTKGAYRIIEVAEWNGPVFEFRTDTNLASRST